MTDKIETLTKLYNDYFNIVSFLTKIDIKKLPVYTEVLNILCDSSDIHSVVEVLLRPETSDDIVVTPEQVLCDSVKYCYRCPLRGSDTCLEPESYIVRQVYDSNRDNINVLYDEIVKLRSKHG